MKEASEPEQDELLDTLSKIQSPPIGKFTDGNMLNTISIPIFIQILLI